MIILYISLILDITLDLIGPPYERLERVIVEPPGDYQDETLKHTGNIQRTYQVTKSFTGRLNKLKIKLKRELDQMI